MRNYEKEEMEALKRLFDGEKEDIVLYSEKLSSENRKLVINSLDWLASSYRGKAGYGYMLNADRNNFYADMHADISYVLKLLEQHEFLSEEDPSWLGVHHKTSLLDAFICTDFILAKQIADYNGPYVELGDATYHYQILYYFCHTMVVAPEESETLLPYLDVYIEHPRKKERYYKGYGQVMKAIIQRDEEALQTGAAKVLEDHINLIGEDHIDNFGYSEDSYICLWLLGLLNLAIALGMKVDIDHKYLPKDLLADPKEAQKAWTAFSK